MAPLQSTSFIHGHKESVGGGTTTTIPWLPITTNHISIHPFSIARGPVSTQGLHEPLDARND